MLRFTRPSLFFLTNWSMGHVPFWHREIFPEFVDLESRLLVPTEVLSLTVKPSLRGVSDVSLLSHLISYQPHDKSPHAPTNCHPTSLQSLNLYIVLQTLALLTNLLSLYHSPCGALPCWTAHCIQEPALWSHVGCYRFWCRRLVLNPPMTKIWVAVTALRSQGRSLVSFCLTPDGYLVERGELGRLPSWLLCRYLYLLPSKNQTALQVLNCARQ